MRFDIDRQAFFALVQAGLWEQDFRLSSFENIDFREVYKFAEEQSVVGLVAAGIEHVVDIKVPQEVALTFVGTALQLEQQNSAMNVFLANLMTKMRVEDIYSLLVKGQGVAQCYERPLWRACGDVDLLLDNKNFEKAKDFLKNISNDVHEENAFDKHFSADVMGWLVELHGSMRSMLPKKTDKEIDSVQDEAFQNHSSRIWELNEEEICLPSADDDVIFVFTHILKHFFHYGIGLRQVCDWCRLLYTYRDELDISLLESRLEAMGLMSEWRAFGSVAVDFLGMPKGSMPFYSSQICWKKKAKRILSFIMETGNFGHKRDTSYYNKYPKIISAIISLARHTSDSIRHFFIFPLDAVKIWGRMVSCGISDALK